MRSPMEWKPGKETIGPGLVARAVAGFRNMFASNANQNTSAVPPPFAPPFDPTVNTIVNWRIQLPPQDWFGPGQPISPVAPSDMAGRAFDYPTYSNIDVIQKPREGVDFPILRQLAASYDLVGLMIDTRCDQICKLGWAVSYRGDSKEADGGTQKIQDFLQCPDKEHSWQEWLRLLLKDMLEIDAATIFPRMTKGGDLYSLETIDGATINRVIDNWGRTPLAPDPAYQQRLKGLPATNYTREQLIYKPRNIATNRLFGVSPVERIVLRVQTAIHKALYQLQYYTDGSTPDLIMSVPGTWQARQLSEFQSYWEGILRGNTAERRGARFVPDGVKVIGTKDEALKDIFDEWLARIICYCFGMSPQPFVSQMNRATAETANEQAKEEGIGPHMAWVKGTMDYVLAHPKCFNRPDLEFAFEDADETDPKVKAEIFSLKVKAGAALIDEWRDADGQDPLPNGLGSKPMIYTAQGAVLLDDVLNPPEPTEAQTTEGVLTGAAAPGADGKPAAKPAEKIRKGMVVNAEYDIPFGFGVSMDGGTIYRDRDMPEMLDVDGVMIDLDETCAVHEIVEQSHCKDGDPYLQGHQKADEQEHALVARQGADPARYETLLEPHLEQAYEKGKAGTARTPPDLATYPYVESGEEDLLNPVTKVMKKKSAEPDPKRVAKLKGHVAKALKATARTIATQYAHKLGKVSDGDLSDFIDGLDLTSLGVLTEFLIDAIQSEAEGAFTDVLVQVGADSEPVFGIANTRAQQIADDRAAELIGSDGDGGELADATRLLIRGTISDAFENGWSSSELSGALESSYAFSEDRADLIAETETRMAIGAGAIEGARASDVVTGKQWLLSNDEGVCDECQGNADQDVIALDDDFDSGDDTVPAHPGCRCVVVFTTDEGDEE